MHFLIVQRTKSIYIDSFKKGWSEKPNKDAIFKVWSAYAIELFEFASFLARKYLIGGRKRARRCERRLACYAKLDKEWSFLNFQEYLARWLGIRRLH